MNAKSKSRLYVLTALACIVWLVQTLYEAAQKNQLLYWPNIIFSVCLLVVIGYTGYCGIKDWNAKPDKKDSSDPSVDTSAEEDEEPDEDAVAADDGSVDKS
jgi:hypothetical protein